MKSSLLTSPWPCNFQNDRWTVNMWCFKPVFAFEPYTVGFSFHVSEVVPFSYWTTLNQDQLQINCCDLTVWSNKYCKKIHKKVSENVNKVWPFCGAIFAKHWLEFLISSPLHSIYMVRTHIALFFCAPTLQMNATRRDTMDIARQIAFWLNKIGFSVELVFPNWVFSSSISRPLALFLSLSLSRNKNKFKKETPLGLAIF